MSIVPVGSTAVQLRTPVLPKQQSTEEAAETVHAKAVEAQPVNRDKEAKESPQDKLVEQNGPGKKLDVLA